ncbi:aromatic-ring hydroxylase C-terminal domain-containing protein [Micromonospora sp. LZ34]
MDAPAVLLRPDGHVAWAGDDQQDLFTPATTAVRRRPPKRRRQDPTMSDGWAVPGDEGGVARHRRPWTATGATLSTVPVGPAPPR